MIRIGLTMIAAATAGIVGCATATTTERAATKTALESERAACAEVPEADRAAGPFARRDRITRVETLLQSVSPKAPAPLAGAAIYVRATPGMTEQWMARIIQCYGAHR